MDVDALTAERTASGPAAALHEDVDVLADGVEGTDGESVDGRTLRRTRNRTKVIVALLDLLNEGRLEPNVADIADRAGVSHRSVFRYFTDINDLVRTAIGYEVQRLLPLAAIENIGMGTFERRLDAWVDSRLRIYAATFQVSRVARLRAGTIPSIDDGMRTINDMAAAGLRQSFAVELELLGSDGEFAIDAALVLTGFESYDLHVRMYRHSTERIRQVWKFALRQMFIESNSDD